MRVKYKSVSIVLAVLLSMVAGIVPGLSSATDLPDFISIVDANSAAVVNISTSQKVQTNQQRDFPHGMLPNMPDGTPFDELFRRFFDQQRPPHKGPEMPPREYDSYSLCSGFIISKDGYILTNYHVIRDADEIIVRLSDRRELVAEVIGSDKRSDVALLKVDAKNLPVVKIGDSSKLKVGEWVVAIGSPFDFDHTVTSGIVSALRRSLPNENYVPFIQTDVAINPGNSGGPLFNMDGEVIGVNAQIYSRTGGFMGLSFTIPIDLAMDVVEQLKDVGHVTRGWLGVQIQDVTRELAESFEMDKPIGALISQVLSDSPAVAAGFEVGDIIIEFNGKEVQTSASLPPMVGVTPVNKNVPVKVMRNGKLKTLKVSIGKLPGSDKVASVEAGTAEDQRFKIDVADLTAEQRDELTLADKGVLVTTVMAGPANDAGIRKGDVIIMIDNKSIKDAKHFRKITAELPAGKPVAVLVKRRDGSLFLAVNLPEK